MHAWFPRNSRRQQSKLRAIQTYIGNRPPALLKIHYRASRGTK